MHGALLRRVALPLLSVAVVGLSLPRLSAEEPTSLSPATVDAAPLVEDPFATGATPAQVEVLQAVWTAWRDDLDATSDRPALPAGILALGWDEAMYVLLTVRAAQAAAADARALPAEELAAALQRQDLNGTTPQITVARVRPGCVAVTYADELYGRAFYGLLTPIDEPGPEPTSTLESGLLRTVRVGLGAADATTCGGGGVAYSPAAQQALRELSPRLLDH